MVEIFLSVGQTAFTKCGENFGSTGHMEKEKILTLDEQWKNNSWRFTNKEPESIGVGSEGGANYYRCISQSILDRGVVPRPQQHGGTEVNADELHGIEMDLMPIGGKERTLPEFVGAHRRSAAGVWNGQVDAVA